MYTSDFSLPWQSCHWADIVSCPLIDNVVTNKIISSVMHIIVCLPKTE